MKKAGRQFKVVIERDEDGFYVAEVPALPGCYTQAKSMSALEKNLREVIALCLNEVRENAVYRKQVRDFAYEPTFVGLQAITV